MVPEERDHQVARIQGYYRFQARIYDLTRWSFLFGRLAAIRALPFSPQEEFHLLEVGCGTGWNLARIHKRFPVARLTGMDVSKDMLAHAFRRLRRTKKVKLLNQPYQDGYYTWTGRLDAIVFSYALTMINPQWPELLQQAAKDLRPGGVIVVVDFHGSRFSWFRNHMGNHHVRMERHLQPVLEELFTPVRTEVRQAYLGVWEYLLFVGEKKNLPSS
ncbi:MAG: class I SAM-dependent methyltransferase [Lewinella sp.]|nr:class I SAM-dependent methyltransferase [Lewinella sp.]